MAVVTVTNGLANVLYDSGEVTGVASIDSGSGGFDTSGRALYVSIYARSTKAATTADTLNITINNDSSAHYNSQSLIANGASVSAAEALGASVIAISVMPAASSDASYFSQGVLEFANYGSTTAFKSFTGRFVANFASTTGSTRIRHVNGLWLQTSAINRIKIATAAGDNFVAGTRMVIWSV